MTLRTHEHHLSSKKNGMLNLCLYYSRHRPDGLDDDKSKACKFDKLFNGVEGRFLSFRPSELGMYGVTENDYKIKKQEMDDDMCGKAMNKLKNAHFFKFGNKELRVAEVNTWLKLKYKIEFDLVAEEMIALLTLEKLVLIQLYENGDAGLKTSPNNLWA